MVNPSSSLRFTVFLSFSLAASSFKHSASLFPSPIPKATAADLLSVLGPSSASSAVDPVVAQELRSCFKFLVPFKPDKPGPESGRCSVRNGLCFGEIDVVGSPSRVKEENELVWWLPKSVHEFARLAVDSGGDPDAIYRALDPKIIRIPDVEGSEEDRCELTRTPYGWRFIHEELNSFFEFLFHLIASRGPNVGLDVSLTRFDLFHGHLFIAPETGRLGILFHAKEYPAYDKEVFPYNMGYCQIGSNVTYDNSMNLRNILWLAPLPSKTSEDWLAPGVLVVLDARPDGVIFRDLIPDYVKYARTIYEDDLGINVVDVNYLNVGAQEEPDYQLFIC